MKTAYMVDAGQLVDDRRVRATVVSWVLDAYPALCVPGLSSEVVEAHVSDAFTSDEELAVRLWGDFFEVPSAAIEPALLRRLVTERRYGSRLYASVFGVDAHVWRGPAALALAERRACSLPSDGIVVVISPRSRVEVMTTLFGTGWGPEVGLAVTGDDVLRSDDAACALLAEGVRRVRRTYGESVAVRVRSALPAMVRAGAVLGLAID